MSQCVKSKQKKLFPPTQCFVAVLLQCSVLFCSVLGDQDSFQSPNLKLATTSVVVVVVVVKKT